MGDVAKSSRRHLGYTGLRMVRNSPPAGAGGPVLSHVTLELHDQTRGRAGLGATVARRIASLVPTKANQS